MQIHELKTLPEFYEKIVSGEKNFELRKNDRNFKIGDVLLLREFTIGKQYTESFCYRLVTYIIESRYGLENGFCCMSLRECTRKDAEKIARSLNKEVDNLSDWIIDRDNEQAKEKTR